jgi:hypothetical protein
MAMLQERAYANLPTGKYRVRVGKTEPADASKAFPNSGPRVKVTFNVFDEDHKKIGGTLAAGEIQATSVNRYFGATLGVAGRRSKLFDFLAACLGDDRREDLERWVTSNRTPGGNVDPEWWVNVELWVFVVEEPGQNNQVYTGVDLGRIRPLDGDGSDNWATVSASMRKHDRELFQELFKPKKAAADDEAEPEPAKPAAKTTAKAATPDEDFSF